MLSLKCRPTAKADFYKRNGLLFPKGRQHTMIFFHNKVFSDIWAVLTRVALIPCTGCISDLCRKPLADLIQHPRPCMSVKKLGFWAKTPGIPGERNPKKGR